MDDELERLDQLTTKLNESTTRRQQRINEMTVQLAIADTVKENLHTAIDRLGYRLDDQLRNDALQALATGKMEDHVTALERVDAALRRPTNE